MTRKNAVASSVPTDEEAIVKLLNEFKFDEDTEMKMSAESALRQALRRFEMSNDCVSYSFVKPFVAVVEDVATAYGREKRVLLFLAVESVGIDIVKDAIKDPDACREFAQEEARRGPCA